MISDEIPLTAMQATMGHLERKSNPKGGTVGDEISLSQNFDRLGMTRRGKADFLFAPYARHKNYKKRKTICINENTYRLILSLIAPTLRRGVFIASACGGDFTLWFRVKGKGKRGYKFISIFREIPFSLIPLP